MKISFHVQRRRCLTRDEEPNEMVGEEAGTFSGTACDDGAAGVTSTSGE